MDAATLTAAAESAFERVVPAETRHRLTLRVDASIERDPLWPDVAASASYRLLPGGAAEIHAYGGMESEDEVETAIVGALQQALDELEIHEELATEEALFEAHARFRAGEPVLAQFYRAGESLAPGIFVVDLDVFVELRVLRTTWSDIRGRRLRLAIDEDGIELEVPDDAESDEFLTLPGAGMLDADDSLSEEDPMPLAGDLHIVPVIYEA